MRRFSRREVASLFAASVLGACAAPSVVPPAVTRDDRGDPFEGGIGGTGIVGLLTGYGSLRINGLRVELTSATRLQTPFGRTSAGALAVGQPLTIVAARTADGAITARDVQVSWPLVGTLRDAGGRLTVNGVPIRAEPGLVGAEGPGARVAVSGVWRRDGVLASRLQPAGSYPDLLAGVVERGPNWVRIGGVPIEAEAGALFPPAGDYLTAIGRHDGAVFRAERVEGGRFRRLAGTLRQLSVEGYLEPVRAAPGFRVAGLGHSFARDLSLAPLSRSRALYFGPYSGLFDAWAGYALPEGIEARRAVLGPGFDGPLARRRVPLQG